MKRAVKHEGKGREQKSKPNNTVESKSRIKQCNKIYYTQGINFIMRETSDCSSRIPIWQQILFATYEANVIFLSYNCMNCGACLAPKQTG